MKKHNSMKTDEQETISEKRTQISPITYTNKAFIKINLKNLGEI